MAVNLKPIASLSPIAGVKLASISAGIYTSDRDDLALIEVTEGAVTSAVFTQNAFCAAPVILAKDHIGKASTRYCLINAGNANAGTGELGYQHTVECCSELAGITGVGPASILPFSTGVIGEYLPVDKVIKKLPDLLGNLSGTNWESAAAAIMTTDTQAKGISKTINIDGQAVTITGIAKGSGMIRPDMATMLAFIATDAKIEQALLDQILSLSMDNSFNRITIDGDTSTNDACVLIATGEGGVEINDFNLTEFNEAIVDVCSNLAQAIVRDGEGASKFVTINVINGASVEDCLEVAYTIAHSPLVKTALFASDPNWGRILAAIGRADVELIISKIDIYINDICIVANGEKKPDYTEEMGQEVMSSEEIDIQVSLSTGNQEAKIWTTDLSYDYVKINAEYRT